jgi:hypothetical protein
LSTCFLKHVKNEDNNNNPAMREISLQILISVRIILARIMRFAKIFQADLNVFALLVTRKATPIMEHVSVIKHFPLKLNSPLVRTAPVFVLTPFTYISEIMFKEIQNS